MLKRILATVLVLVTVIGLLPVLPVSNMTAEAASVVASGTCGDNLTWVLDAEGTLTISGTGAMDNWSTEYGDEAPWSSYEIKSIIITEGVTTIGNSAFAWWYESLESVTIPKSITHIGEYAFDWCDSIEKVNISSLEEWCNITFADSESNPVSHAKLYINGALITDIIIPNTVDEIKNYAFAGCESLESISISDSVTSIGDFAFAWCDSLESVTIPNSIKSVGEYAFSECIALNRVNIDSIEAWCNISFFDLDSNPLYYAKKLYLNGELVTDITFPASVTGIGDYAFCSCEFLKSVTFSDSIKSIGANAFYDCALISDISLPDSVTDVGYGAFNGTAFYENADNWSDDSLYIDRILIKLKESFSGNYSIKNGTLTIADNACNFCSELTGVTIPDSVISIGDQAFYGCGLKEIAIPDSVRTIGANAFNRCYLESVHIPKSVVEIGSKSFNCGTLKSISVDSSSLYFCTIDGVLFSKDKTTLVCYPAAKTGDKYVIPDSVLTIGDGAFLGCDNLNAVDIPDGVTTIGAQAFWGHDEFTSLRIPGSVKTIGNGAFYLCRNLEEIVFEYGVETIGASAFAWCEYGETTVTIPSSVKSIGVNAFYISYVTDIYFMGSEEEWEAIDISPDADISSATVHFHDHTYGSDSVCTVCGYPNKITVSALSGTVVTSNNAAYAVGTTTVKPNEVTLSITESTNGNTLVSALGANAKNSNKAYEIALKDSDGNKVTMTSGSITITLPFPTGITSANYKEYDFELYHFLNSAKYEKLNITVNEKGVTFTTGNFSPFLLTYEKKAAPTTTSTTTTTTKKPTTTTTTTTTTKKPTTSTTTKATTTTTRPTAITQTVTRIAGGSRTQTAVAISNKAFKTAATVILADGNGYADSLAGVPLAYALNAPILLVRNSKLDADTTAEITRLGAKKVIILGGELAISKDVVNTLQKMGITVERIAGKSRFDTAVEIAKKLENVTGKKPTEVFFAFSHGYADALSIGGVAAVKKAPILYIAANGVLSDGTKSYLQSSGAKTATILGGKLAIAEAAEGNIKKAGASSVSRVFGQSRFATCIEINKKYASVLTGSAVCVATGMDYPDALAGGVFAAKNGAPLVLVPKTLTDVQTGYIDSRDPANIYIFGGEIAVSKDIENQLKK